MVSVEVKIELGHRAIMKEKVSPEGFTHDWTIFVRGVEGNNIHFFVEKVVFHLHESFPKPKRVVKDPPYSVSESGYAGFIMPIDVYFRSKEEPKKVTFKYDLYLRLEPSPVNNIRIEKLTFNNPSDDFRIKLLQAGGISNTTGSASGGTASLSTQACLPPPHIEDHPPPSLPPPTPAVLPKPAVAEKKPRPHVPSKEIKQPSQPPPPKPSQPFTDIFGAPIRTKNSPSEKSSSKAKDSGHSSQVKSKSSLNSFSNSASSKEGKLGHKESQKSKDNHHSSKEPRHTSKENHHSSKESHLAKEAHHSSKEVLQEKSTVHLSKDSSKESHHSNKEVHHKSKEYHLKEGHKKESHHSSKEAKPPKDNRPSDPKDSKLPKPLKADKDPNKSGIKRAAPTDAHDSHGNAEKKKKLSPVPFESSDKSNSHSKNKIKESKDKSTKQKVKPHSNSLKKEEEKLKHRSSPAPPPEPAEPKEMPKLPKPYSPKPPSTPPLLPPPVIKQPPPPKSPPPPPVHSPSPSSPSSSDSDDESHKSSYNKAHYSSPASSISESSLHSNIAVLSDRSIISPLSDDDDDFSPPPPKRKTSSDSDLDDRSQEAKPVDSRPVQKLNKKYHYKSSKHKTENLHQGNGSIHSDISVPHSPPSPEEQSNSTSNSTNNNSSYIDELVEIQRKIMSSEDRKLLQNIVDVIETTGKYEITNTTFDFDLCSLDRAIIQKIKLYLTNCDKC